MMSEKTIIQKVEFFIRNSAINKMDSDFYKNGGWEVIDLEISKAVKGLLELYKNLKEIEKTHQEENGKLRVELEQEKEKNKELQLKYMKLESDRFYTIRNMMKYREFELQQQYKDFEEDAEWKTYKKILEEK